MQVRLCPSMLCVFLCRYQSEPDLSLAAPAGLRPQRAEEKGLLPLVPTRENYTW